MRPRTLCPLFLALLLIATPGYALVNGQEPEADDTRFDAVAAFSRTNWLIDNPGDQVAHNWFGAGVLIAPDVVLIAKHLLPDAGRTTPRPGQFSVRFRRHADGSVGSVNAGPNSFHQVSVGAWVISDRMDLALGILSQPVEHIEPARVLLESDPIEAQTVMLAGWGSESRWQGAPGPRRGLRVGENTATSAGAFIRVLSYETEQRQDNQGRNRNFITDSNAVPNMHDSGGSMFLMNDQGEPVLAGIITTYAGGTFLPAAVANGFPLEAATHGSEALLQAVAERGE